ncbi:zinc dependent phospholipase C family protein [Pseudopedobacter beijingensis]|uniref:Zinc dependent phospholipase C family protein n=1 Tax=Pseudopedobacter beijingensis TaxID=1207056 RepID=A0ABW4IG65_9SPHI
MMKKNLTRTIVLLGSIILLSSWGFYAHKRIARLAVFTLPKDLIVFYKGNINTITERSVNPDKRRGIDPLEGQRHFLDADYYGENPFDSIPVKWKDAINKFSQDTLQTYGTVPWQIEKVYYQLVKAFAAKDSANIIRLSADLSHYIADAHVPLHTSMNYNGQLTNQIGIHAFWESRLPELFAKDYDYFVGPAKYIDNPLQEAWRIVKETYSLVPLTLKLEKETNGNFAPDKKYTYSQRNNKVIKQYSEEYSRKYHEVLNGMVEKQMRKAILATGSFWYSAWIDAGQPNLKAISRKDIPIAEQNEINKEEQLYLQGKVLGREDL